MTGTMDSARLVFETAEGSSMVYRETWEAVGRDGLRTMLEYRRVERWVLGSRAATGERLPETTPARGAPRPGSGCGADAASVAAGGVPRSRISSAGHF